MTRSAGRPGTPSETAVSKSAERRWNRETRDRTRAKHEQTAAEAVAGAASLRAPGITSVTQDGDEAVVHLRGGATLDVHVPGMGRIACIRAGDGWAIAVISPRVLHNGAQPPSGDPGDGWRAPWGDVAVAPYIPNAAVAFPSLAVRDDLCEHGWSSGCDDCPRGSRHGLP
jgi:hypothetical protein